MRHIDPEEIDTIVIHISDSYYGDVSTIRQWHKDRGWDDIGYHFVITNCFPTRYKWEAKKPDRVFDGKVHTGRSLEFEGAHVQGHNGHSIGICMIGKKGGFTSKEIDSAIGLCKLMMNRFPTIEHVKGHYEFTDQKTCPDLDMDLFREWCQDDQ